MIGYITAKLRIKKKLSKLVSLGFSKYHLVPCLLSCLPAFVSHDIPFPLSHSHFLFFRGLSITLITWQGRRLMSIHTQVCQFVTRCHRYFFFYFFFPFSGIELGRFVNFLDEKLPTSCIVLKSPQLLIVHWYWHSVNHAHLSFVAKKSLLV